MRRARRKSSFDQVVPFTRMETMGKLRVRSTLVIGTFSGMAVMAVLPRCTVTPLTNSTTDQLMVTLPLVPIRVKVIVVGLVSWPVIAPSSGAAALCRTSNTRKLLLRSTAVMVAVVDADPAARTVVFSWMPLSTTGSRSATDSLKANSDVAPVPDVEVAVRMVPFDTPPGVGTRKKKPPDVRSRSLPEPSVSVNK